jgi:hypothetical protein
MKQPSYWLIVLTTVLFIIHAMFYEPATPEANDRVFFAVLIALCGLGIIEAISKKD